MNTFIFDHAMAGTHPTTIVADWGEPIAGLPMLPPPKRFLLPGSIFHTSMDTTYRFSLDKDRRPHLKDAVDVHTSKIRIYPDKIQLIRAKFFFKRATNSMAEAKMGFSMLTYSIEKHALYYIQFIKPNKRWVKTIKRISLNKFCIKRLDAYERTHKDRWVKALAAAVKRDVPDMCDECVDIRNRIIALIIQHRVGKGIPGLDDILIDNLSHVVSSKHLSTLAHKITPRLPKTDKVPYALVDQDAIDATVKRLQRRTVYKFLPTLQKTGSMVKAFKVLFGKHFNRTLIKIITHMNIEHIGNGSGADFIYQYNDLAPTGAKHMLSSLLKEEDYHHATHLANQIAVVMNVIEQNSVSIEIVSNWSKTMSRIGKVISWITWSDTYNMAEQLRTRVRPSRFNSIADIDALHDAYTTLIMATGGKGNSLNLPPEELIFLPVDIPTVFKGWYITQLLSQEDLTLESKVMGHCVAGYAEGCMLGSFILLTIHDSNDNKLWTAQYGGDNFTYFQAEGKVNDDDEGRRSYPPQDIIDTVLKPLGKAIERAEAGKPLSYDMRSDLRAKHISMMHGLITIEESTLEDDVIEEHIEAVNCRIERVVEILNLLNQKVPPPNDHLLQLVAKIDAEGADRFLTRRNHNMPAVPVAMAPPPIPLGPNAQLAGHQPGDDNDFIF